MSLRTNFMYFYRTKIGGYELTPVWPPVANDADDSGNHDPEDLLDDGQGILQIANKSETGKVIYDIMIDGYEFKNVMLAKDDTMRFTLAAGIVNVALRPQGQMYYGLTLPREIKNKKITYLNYYDNLGNPDELPDDETGYGTGLLKIINYSLSVVTEVRIIDPDNTASKMIIESEGFTPQIPVNYSQTGRVGVVGTADFPLQPAKSYLIEVILKSGSVTKVFRQHSVIRDQIVTIRLNERDLSVYNPSVYVAGYYDNSRQGSRMACYWKDGVRIDLPPNRAAGSIATAVAVSGGKVYVSGYLEGYDSEACYWVDGTRIRLTDTDLLKYGEARDITVSGNTVYTAGFYLDTDMDYSLMKAKPCYWTNTGLTLLPMPTDYVRGVAESIVVLGGKVYIAGWYAYEDEHSYLYYKACYWVKEGSGPAVRHDLPDNTKVFDIAVVGGYIYVAGAYNFYEGDFSPITPCYWRVDSSFNATRISLPNPNGEWGIEECFANAIAVDNGTVHITGSTYDYTYGANGTHDQYTGGIAYGVIYWKNGVLTHTSGAPAFGGDNDWGETRDIAVYEGKVYIAGGHMVEEAQVEDSPVPCYWKDGQAVNLYDPTENEEIRLERIGIATGIAIGD
jgi:hypothetical protein